MPYRTLFRVATCTLAAVLLSACATTSGSDPGSGGSGSAAAVSPAPESSSGAASSGAAPSGCITGRSQVVIQPAQSPEPRCLSVGATLVVDAPSVPQQPWQPLTISDQTVLDCTTTPVPDNGFTATCRAAHPGTATLTTTTAPFAGDPHGPPQMVWQLTVRVAG